MISSCTLSCSASSQVTSVVINRDFHLESALIVFAGAANIIRIEAVAYEGKCRTFPAMERAVRSEMFNMAERFRLFLRTYSFALLSRREDHAVSRELSSSPVGVSLPSGQSEQNGTVGSLIGRQQKRSRRIDSKSARDLPRVDTC